MRAALAAAWLLVACWAGKGCTPPECRCEDSCLYSRDGECDDSGPGSMSSKCPFGTDCHDCGKRNEESLGNFMCMDRCHSRRDGVCDDGGPGACRAAELQPIGLGVLRVSQSHHPTTPPHPRVLTTPFAAPRRPLQDV